MADQRASLMIVTPRGTAVYPKLNKPDTKFDEAGVYETKVRLSPDSDDAVIGKTSVTQAELFDALESMRDKFAAEKRAELAASKDPKAKAKAKTLSVKDIGEAGLDDDGNEDGTRVLKAKMKASGVSPKGPWTREPKLFDSRNKAIDIKGPAIYGGSTVKVAAKAVPYYMAQENAVGVTLYLEAVQVIDLVSGGGRSASAFGFGAEEGGYAAEETAGSAFSDEGASAGSEGNDDF